MRIPSILCTLSLALALPTGCKKEQQTEDPDGAGAGSNLIGPNTKGDDSIGSLESEDGEETEDTDEEKQEAALAEELVKEDEAKGKKAPALPPKAKPVTKCTGKGKKKVCKEVDPKPEVSASYGVVAMMGDFTWGM